MERKSVESVKASRYYRYSMLLFLLSTQNYARGFSFGQTLFTRQFFLRETSFHEWGTRRSRIQSQSTGRVLSAVNRRRSSPGILGDANAEAASSGGKAWKALTPQEEKGLCEQMVENRRIQELQETLEMSQGRPVSVHEWAVAAGYPSAHQLLGALQEGRKAERMLLMGHHALLLSVAERYRSVTRSLSMKDLVQEGRIGLLQAVEKFDPSKGARFSTYAVFRIKAAILRAIADKDRLVRVPVYAQDLAMQVLAASHALEAETGSAPTDAQLALALTMPEEKVALYRRSVLSHNVQDLEREAREAKGESGKDWPLDAPRLADIQIARDEVLGAMRKCLSPAEERALRLRYGLVGNSQMETGRTFMEVGRMMELSAEGIRKMVMRAIRKLQDSEEAYSLLLAFADGR